MFITGYSLMLYVGVLWLAKTRVLSRKLEEGINALVKYGIRFTLKDGEVYIDWRDWRRYDRLCEESKLPPSVC